MYVKIFLYEYQGWISEQAYEVLVGGGDNLKETTYTYLKKIFIALLLVMWYKILQRQNSTNKYFQDFKMNLHKIIKSLNSLKKYNSKLRNDFK